MLHRVWTLWTQCGVYDTGARTPRAREPNSHRELCEIRFSSSSMTARQLLNERVKGIKVLGMGGGGGSKPCGVELRGVVGEQ